MASCQILSPAKVNLYLGVQTERTDEGKHKLHTLMQCIDFYDKINLSSQDSSDKSTIELSCKPEIEGLAKEDNLAYKAALLMCEHFNKQAHITIELEKHIPHRAGLAGGSSNAAAILVGLAHLWGLGDQTDSLKKLASELGSDVAFFIDAKPAFMGGIGDELVEEFEPLKGSLVMIKPAGGVDTKEAYRRFDERPDRIMPNELILIGMREGNTELVASHVANNLELAAVSILPEISHVQAWLGAQRGSNNPHITGSGSCVFSIFDTEKEAQEAYEAAKKHSNSWWVEKTTLSDAGIRIL